MLLFRKVTKSVTALEARRMILHISANYAAFKDVRCDSLLSFLVFCFIKVFKPKRTENSIKLFIEVKFFEIDLCAVLEIAS